MVITPPGDETMFRLEWELLLVVEVLFLVIKVFDHANNVIICVNTVDCVKIYKDIISRDMFLLGWQEYRSLTLHKVNQTHTDFGNFGIEVENYT